MSKRQNKRSNRTAKPRPKRFSWEDKDINILETPKKKETLKSLFVSLIKNKE